MPTISALRRRGFTPESIRTFAERVGVSKRENIIDFGFLEFCVREHLNKIANRAMVVLDPVKLVIENYPSDKSEILMGENNPEEEDKGGLREIPFNKELYIERDDFKEVAEKKYFRLAIGAMVRLKSAYIIKGESCVKDNNGKITEIRCTYFPESKSGNDTSGLSAKGTLHWVDATSAIPVEVRLYDRLFKVENPSAEDGEMKEYINPASLKVISNAMAEPSISNSIAGDKFQFLRKGYFCVDINSSPDHLIFNRTVTLKDGWAKAKK